MPATAGSKDSKLSKVKDWSNSNRGVSRVKSLDKGETETDCGSDGGGGGGDVRGLAVLEAVAGTGVAV